VRQDAKCAKEDKRRDFFLALLALREDAEESSCPPRLRGELFFADIYEEPR
jgi:hypothetical protein